MVKKLAAKLLRYCAMKSHDVQVQLLCATIHGLVDIFGIGGAFAILLKARKIAHGKKPSNRVTAKPANIQVTK